MSDIETVANIPATAVQPRKKRVVIALPGSHFSNNFLISWTQSLFYLWEHGYNVVVSPATSSFVTFCRMKTLGLDVLRGKSQKPFNGELDYDVYVSLDSDIVFTPSMIVELIESTDVHPVVSGYYMMSDAKHLAVVKDWSVAHFIKNGTFKFLTPEDIATWKNAEENAGQKFMEVSYAGLGFFACRREVLESLEYPFFDCPLQRIYTEDGREIVDMCSEDVALSKNIQAKGYKVQLHVDLRVGHEKPIIL
jgi:hypothetical protein